MSKNNKNEKGFWSFLTRGWDYIIKPSDIRCDIYKTQFEQADSEAKKENISKKEKKYWRKEKEKAINGLGAIHRENSEGFVKIICALGAGLLIGNKLLNVKK